MSGPGFIAVQPPEKCDLCGAFEECRPYGPNGENICVKCGTKDEAALRISVRQFYRKVLGESIQ